MPVVLGKDGLEKVIEVDLNADQKAKFMQSIDAIKANLKQVPESYLA